MLLTAALVAGGAAAAVAALRSAAKANRVRSLLNARESLIRCRRPVEVGVGDVRRAAVLAAVFAPPVLLSPLSPLLPDLWWRSLRWSLETAGPVWVKVAQWASCRPDLIPQAVCDRLSVLRAGCSAHPFSETLREVRESLPEGVETFSFVEPEPVASGALAQVHRAVLRRTGEDVAVKVLHPRAADRVSADLRLMSNVARRLSSVVSCLKWVSFLDAVADFSDTLQQHLDLRVEACNLQLFNERFSSRGWSSLVRFPRPLKGLCAPGVLVESYERGEKLDVTRAPRRLSRVLLGAFMKMLFQDNFVHLDLHAGNVLVRHDGQSVTFLDAGLASPLRPEERLNHLQMCQAFVSGDVDAASEIMLKRSPESGQTGSTVEQEKQFKEGMARLLGRLGNDNLGQIRVTSALKDAACLAHRCRVRLDGRFSSLVLATGILDGLARQIDPTTNIAVVAAPWVLFNKVAPERRFILFDD